MISENTKTSLLATASFLLPFLALELYFRIFPFESYQTNDPYQYTEVLGDRRILVPNHDYSERYPAKFDVRGYYYQKDEGRVHYRSDRFGARWVDNVGQSVAVDSVLALGDSFTYGFGLRYEDSYLYLTQRKLRLADAKVSIFNFAHPGASSEKVLKVYRQVRHRVPHRLVLYGLHINDLMSFPTNFTAWNPILKLPLIRHSRVASFVAQRVHVATRRKSSIEYFNDPGRFKESFFYKNMRAIESLRDDVAQAGKDFRIVVLPLLVDVEQDTFAPMYQRLRSELRTRDLPYIDLTGTITTGSDPQWWILPFDQHPNERANALFAERLTAELLASELF